MSLSESSKTISPLTLTTLSPEETLSKLGSSWGGLPTEEAEARLVTWGKNELKKEHRLRWSEILLHQFTDILIWILLTAAFFSLIFGEFRDTTIILIIVSVNALIGFVQEYKAERILDRLRELETDRAIVIRDGQRSEINSRELVPGDMIALDAGTTAPADVRLLESFSLKVNTILFTGEAHPRKKNALPLSEMPASLPDAENIILSGESVTTGEARGVVIATGSATELGHLATMTARIEEEPTPLQKKMSRLGKAIALLSLVIGIAVIAIGRNGGLSWYDNFLLALALAVSIVPEGLPAAISIAFALGMKRLLKFRILAKKLNAVETLGSVTTICTDKTGTITKGELTVTHIILGHDLYDVSGEGYEPRGGFFRNGKAVSPASILGAETLFKIGVLANSASLITRDDRVEVVGDSTEGAILVASRKYHPDPDFFRIGETKIFEHPFSSERMRMSALFQNSGVTSYVKGSPDVLLARATKQLKNGREVPFPETDRNKTKALYDELSAKALRVLAFGYRTLTTLPESERADAMERDIVWVGMMAMVDPPRPGVRDAILECRDRGLRVVMITGDYEVTAAAIAKNIALIDESRPYKIVNGKDLATLSDDELFSQIQEKDAVFARITPEQKLRIATVLKDRGETIAMTGDGVNDAPALKKADIGVAMGITGTDVSKEAADMILLDDNFSNIVYGIREGRTIFSNLKKFVHYVFTSNVSELFTVLLGFALGIPAPILAVQILAIDLGTDVFPSLALGVEPEEPHSSKQGSAENTASVIDREGVGRLLRFGLLMALGAVTAFLLSLLRGGWQWGDAIDTHSALYQKSTAATYTTLALTQMANLLQSRSATLSFFSLPFFSNPWIWISMTFSLFLLWVVTSSPLQSLLSLQTPDALDWMTAMTFTVLIFTYEEIRKRHALKKAGVGEKS
ncbi:MAG: cation-translocating P-type ATPase [Candidatus Moraniibacteriota bacterium]|nr:MAG: cation-translocating P-type ATPase [Candidatus Moranbacteria bacterium]